MSRLATRALHVAIGVCIVGTGLGVGQQTQSAQQAAALTVEKIRGNLYMVKGGIANTGFAVETNGVIVIDAEMTPDAARQMLEEIRKVTPLPILHVILTHSDGDHVNGLPGFPKGLKIIAHENARKDMDKATTDIPALKDYLPTQTFTNELSVRRDGGVMELRNFGPAHTSGDTVVYFMPEKCAFVGDLVFIGRDPLIHRHKNGSCAGLVATLKAILNYQPSTDLFIPGHGNPVTRSDVEALIKSIEEKRAQIQELVRQGKSLDEVKTALKVEDRPAQPGRPRFPSLAEAIYLELTEKK